MKPEPGNSAGQAQLINKNGQIKGIILTAGDQPKINIISNPNFQQQQAPTTNELPITSQANSLQHQFTNQAQTPNTSNNENCRSKPKRNTASLSSSLRRLISITFSRNSQSSSSSNNNSNGGGLNIGASGSQAKKGKEKKKQRDKSLLYKQTTSSSNSKRRQLTSVTAVAAATSAQRSSISSSQFNPILHQTTLEKNLINQQRTNSRRSSSFAAAPTQQSTGLVVVNDGNVNQSNRRQLDSSDKKEGRDPISSTSSWTSPLATNASTNNTEQQDTQIDGKTYIECPLCVLLVSEASTPYLASCRHRVCLECMQRYITTEINHSRLHITCPICSEPIHPNTIKNILQNEKYYLKYESFLLRRVLAAEPDARWCPAPDCGYVVLANGCASCPKLVCGREGCNTSFCYHCKQEWHPNQTCSAASIQRNKRLINAYNIADLIEESSNNNNNNNNNTNSNQSPSNRKSSKSSQRANSIRADDIRECPVCASRIIKMNDGSCNHMTCSICETEFCWLCMKEISDLHYFSPSGCTFWGKKPWSRKKKLLWQLGMLVGAPICIILIAGIAVPAIVIGIPVWAARKLHNRLERKPFSRSRKNAIITGGVLLSFVISPIISAVALAIGIPILLGYVYGVVPLSLCRSSGGCLSSPPSLENLQHEFQAARNANILAKDGISIDTAMSHKLGDPSIGETSIYMSNISLETNSIGHVTNVEREDRESASNAGLAGSIISNTADDGNSTRALAGSIISKESGYTLIPAEVHSLNLHQQLTTTTSAATQTTTTTTTSNQVSQLEQQQQQSANQLTKSSRTVRSENRLNSLDLRELKAPFSKV